MTTSVTRRVARVLYAPLGGGYLLNESSAHAAPIIGLLKRTKAPQRGTPMSGKVGHSGSFMSTRPDGGGELPADQVAPAARLTDNDNAWNADCNRLTPVAFDRVLLKLTGLQRYERQR